MHYNRGIKIFSYFLHFFAKNLIIMPQIWIFCQKWTNFISIQLEIIDYIFAKFMNHYCAKFYSNANDKYWYDNFFPKFLRFLHKFWLFSPNMFHFGHIKPDIIANIFCKVMEYPCTNFYTIRSSNINTTNIFQFFSILYRIWIFCPNFATFRPIQLGIIDNILRKVYEPPLCKILHQCIK